jgi:sulfur carrier protein ThiS
MLIDVKLYSRFREVLPREARGETTIELPQGATVADLLDHLKLPSRVKLITIDGEQVEDRGIILHQGASVHIYPVVVGG